jgi:uncharacterized membrane protein YgdD (TMEM256/DUF423 family)
VVSRGGFASGGRGSYPPRMIFARLGAAFAMLAVLSGAFGAHALRSRLPADRLAVLETAVRWQMFHAIALIVIAIALEQRPRRALLASGWLFVAGILLFAVSLDALALTGTRGYGAITPIGGACFIAGWLVLALGWSGGPEAS